MCWCARVNRCMRMRISRIFYIQRGSLCTGTAILDQYQIESCPTNMSSNQVPCTQCADCFESKVLLAVHVKAEHGKERNRNIFCSECLEVFTRKAKLLAHLEETKHTQQIKEKPPQSKNIYCCECEDESFTRLSKLRDHIESHHRTELKKEINRSFPTIHGKWGKMAWVF